ncbi:Hypothetical_protein [Hexamita inflata]|uniref:Hypothetical_protein n=1 Tax=Hexamita inflata TaxID=28002 RepID=A0AA86RC97_9EUKA|nr:Hypothetical protein HINF_LOCUS62525 [Hexamita inflata]
MEQAVMELESNVIDVSQDNVNSSMIKRLPKQIVKTNTDKRETQHKPEQNQEQNKPLTQNNVQPQKLTPCIQSKLMQQIPLALKKVLADSGYNVKDATEKELCALVLFMNYRQKTQIDLWNRVAQLCDVDKAELQKFFNYHYNTVLYYHSGNNREYNNTLLNDLKITKFMYDKYQINEIPNERKETGREQYYVVPKSIPALPKIDLQVDTMSISELPSENDSYSV